MGDAKKYKNETLKNNIIILYIITNCYKHNIYSYLRYKCYNNYFCENLNMIQ